MGTLGARTYYTKSKKAQRIDSTTFSIKADDNTKLPANSFDDNAATAYS
jgi:hypothetical protein